MKTLFFKASFLCLPLIAALLFATVLFSPSVEVRTAAAPAQAERVFFGNLHSHTSYSDGSGTPDEAYKHARDDQNARLDFMALTEHNHAEALGPDNRGIATEPALYKGLGSNSLISTAKRLTEDGRFVALYGQEFSTISSGHHVNVFDVGEVIAIQKGRFDLLLDFLAANKDTSGQLAIIMLNHPKNTLEIEAKEYGRDDFGTFDNWVKRMGAQVRLIQMINGPGQSPGENLDPARPDENAFLKYLNMGFKVAPTADQDNHQKNWGSATPVPCKKFLSTRPKEGIGNALIKLSPVRQVVVETINQTAPGKREVDLALPSARDATWPMVLNGRVELARHFVPRWVGRQRPYEA